MINFEDSTTSSQDVAEKPVKDWRSKFEAGLLTSVDVSRFFSENAPVYAELETEADSVRYVYNEPSAKTNIIDPLIEFICGTNADNLIERLKSENNAPSVCGKVFRIGEPTYSCRGCGMDSTCVLCVNCFKQSAHRYHKYKMSTSGGGGCCDCGDTEAWKSDPYCEEHMRGMKKSTENSLVTNSMRERCDIAFRAILMYCVKNLEIESRASLECSDTGPEDDTFCTVLYNDESHTFEQVIQTLIKICKCSQRDAMEFVTSIDREGRAVVKVDSFETCLALKEAIEKQPMRHSTSVSKSPLRVSVLNKRSVSCQQFALQLLTWFQEFLTLHQSFRQIFATAISDKQCPQYNIGHILKYDWKLWKTARSCWHRLFISGMLMEYENKKILAIEFSRNYAEIIQDFIRDDHDHSISIVSLSVQLFTAPTIAHYLIANEDIFKKLMHVFNCESINKYVQNNTLQFAKNTANLNVFKRAAYILYDLRYILSFKPDVWTTELRIGFIEGVKVLLKLLNVMQGMDAVQRQTGQHMDYEPEWESAFNLHIKLALGISLVLDWCSADKECLIKVYQLVMKHLLDNEFIVKNTVVEEKTLAGHVAPCVMYDVASKPVSIHLPLSRFFAGIYLHLGKYGLNFYNVTSMQKRTPEEIIEPVLCTQTMIAQVHAGMWRRNGYSLLHQLYFYRNARCRSEMLDRDIAALQIGAALIESNQYLIHILNKFALLEWADPGYESVYRNYTDDEYFRQLNMIDEFLELLIVIIGERYVPGIGDVTEDDRIKKEIIQLLCIKNFSHSELNRCFPDSNNEMALEDVIDSIAVFKKPQQGNAKGVYELKEEFYDNYNMYFYHYTKEDKSKSEENQRFRRKSKNQLVCCPPPKLPKLAEGFVSIANLLQCDVMLSVIRTVLSRALDLKAKSFTESHLQKTLHLIGYGLLEEESGNYPFLTFYERAVEQDILNLLEKLTHSARVEAHRDFIIWTVKKFKELQPKVSETEMETDDQNEPMTTTETERREKEERARLAAERRAKIMAQMANAQKNFMKSNAELFASTSTSYQSNDTMEWQEPTEDSQEDNQSIVCIGPKRKIHQPEEQKFKCILCFEDCVVSKDGPCLVYSAFIQKSKVLVANTESNIPPSPHVGTCGHVMHASCWKEYFENEIQKENRRPNRNRSPNNYLIDKKEFLCPYCRCLSNGVIPVSPPLSKYIPALRNEEGSGEHTVVSFETWVSIMQDYLEDLYVVERNIDIQDGKAKYPELASIAQKYTNVDDFLKISQPRDQVDISTEWSHFAEIFMGSVQRVCPYEHTAEECEPFLVAWNSCAYTIQALEMYLRAVNKPLKGEMSIRHKSCLSGLIRVCSLLGACITEVVAGKLMIHLRGILETVFKHKGSSVVEWDVFQMLTSIVFMEMVMDFRQKSHMIPTGDYFEYYFLQLMFLGNLAKAIVLFRNDSERYMDVDSSETEEDVSNTNIDKNEPLYEAIGAFYRKYNVQLKEKNGPDEAVEVSPGMLKRLIEHVKHENKTFLRCSCLLFHFMTDVEFPDQFCDVNGDTFENMCKYLGLNPEIESYFDPTNALFKTLALFASHPNIQQSGNAASVLTCVPCVTPVKKLVKLPDDYSDLINSVSDFTCPSSPKEESRNPTMCLVCGTMLCSQSYCCQPELERSGTVGACTHHAHYCGAEIGMFLRIRDCEILLLGIGKGCFVSPPYLDEYGETDQGLRRGNPLRLCHEKYNKLHLMWLGHGLHEEIARLNENTNSVIATQWQHI